MKTDITKKLEQLLMLKFDNLTDFFCFECTIGWLGHEVVDCIKYDNNRIITCYEIKSSVSDFRSKSAKTFIGNKNYFVMPYSVYQKVKDEIPAGVGVFVAIDHMEFKEASSTTNGVTRITNWAVPVDGLKELYCIQNATQTDLKADKEVILSSMLRSMQRDLCRKSRFAYEDV